LNKAKTILLTQGSLQICQQFSFVIYDPDGKIIVLCNFYQTRRHCTLVKSDDVIFSQLLHTQNIGLLKHK
jgi:hypothetical protein